MYMINIKQTKGCNSYVYGSAKVTKSMIWMVTTDSGYQQIIRSLVYPIDQGQLQGLL